MTKHLTFILFLFSVNTWSQTEFFNSKINLSESELDKFYSSFSIDSSQVYFNANDYYVYAYDKETGVLNWSHYLANKTNNAPIPYQTNLFVSKHLSEYNNKCVQLNTKTGDTIQTLVIESINTKPIFKNNIMFCSGIDAGIGGAVLAYDLKKNNVIWEKFIAHGVDKQPYFMKDKIIANAEDDNWFELDYYGKLLDTTCKYKTNLFVEDIKCVQNFVHLTHDDRGIAQYFLQENFGDYENLKVRSYNNYTFLLGYTKLMILGNKLKIYKDIDVDQIITLPETGNNDLRKILKIDDNTIWFFYKNLIVVYDYKKGKTVKTFDLSQWRAHEVILDGNNLWLISQNDGQLVGLKLEPDPTDEALRAAKAKLFNQTHQCGNEVEVMNAARKKALDNVKK
jgi:hypothetical protein